MIEKEIREGFVCQNQITSGKKKEEGNWQLYSKLNNWENEDLKDSCLHISYITIRALAVVGLRPILSLKSKQFEGNCCRQWYLTVNSGPQSIEGPLDENKGMGTTNVSKLVMLYLFSTSLWLYLPSLTYSWMQQNLFHWSQDRTREYIKPAVYIILCFV